eukprot:GFUD01047800.1.p1 GENE.GFUD01047800.1~~GFUD01047800.1.p1  ORF type:complete len:172 (+),score=37.47 GFUD01047800.1:55-570(+)
MSTPLNLYGIPFRSWLLLNQNSSWIRQAELKTNQFSSQERNQEVQRKPELGFFQNFHTSFHLYFVTIVTILSAIISAFVFLIIMWRTYKHFSHARKTGCENHKLSPLPIVDKRQLSPPLQPAVLPGNSRICQEVTNTKVKTRHLPSTSSSQHWASYQLPPGRLYGTKMDSV